MGHIYLITDHTNGKQYVGQTTDSVENRFNRGHIRAAKRLQRAKEENDNSYICCNSYFYNSMIDHGMDKFTVETIATVADNELDEQEIHFIQKYNTLRPNGYNLTTGGGHFRHHESTKDLMRELAITAAPNHIDKYRKDETKGLPMYIVSHNKGNSRGFAVCGHSLCKYKSFTMVNYTSMDECKVAALKFVEDLESNGIAYVPPKKANVEFPTGMTVFRNGYAVRRKINGVIYKQTFEGKNISDDVKKQNAIEYANSLQLIIQG